MRLLLWIVLTSALAVEGAMVLPLLAGLAIIGCADARCGRGVRAWRTRDLFIG